MSGLGLLAVATLVVDVIAVRLMPGRQVYKKFKYEETPHTEGKGPPIFPSFQFSISYLPFYLFMTESYETIGEKDELGYTVNVART